MRNFKMSLGKSRYSKTWKNTEFSWSDFIEKIKNTVRTYELYHEYIRFSKDKKGEIKDVGGFVAGHLKDGKRARDNVLCRSMLTLDLDFATSDFWQDLTLFNDYCCALYSTHSHSPKTPRFRLIIPLSRDVNSEEYEAISRYVANEINIELFDDTTYQASRVMYWPSTAKDGEFIFEAQDGNLLDVDHYFNKYPNWQDVSFWPTSSRVNEIIKKEVGQKQMDPLSKKGLIGAFCKTYTISDVIERWLSDVYVPGTAGRYTYVKGSTSNGLVVYEDTLCYSNHSTDPVSQKTCNAFDLVRIHLYGHLDENTEVKESTKLPSYKAMLELVTSDDSVKKTLIHEKLEDVDIELLEEEKKKDDELNWINRLALDKNGLIKPTINNIILILKNDKKLKNIGGFNLFSSRHEVFGRLPWYLGKERRNWRDDDDVGLRAYLERIYQVSSPNRIADAVIQVVRDNEFHPVREYLEALDEWDEVDRIDTLLIDYLGATDCEYVRSVTRKMLIGAVARIMRPGCKMDNTIILVGNQGLGKSTFIRKLAKSDEWFSDSVYTFSGKEALENLRGKWILEMAELAGMKKSEIETIKNFISSNSDAYRGAYKRHAEDYPRQCVFIGSTNEQEFLRDATGNRRFWPVRIGQQETAKDIFKHLSNEVDQIWAEALAAFNAGEGWHADKRLSDLAKEQQDKHVESNGLEGIIDEYLRTELPAEWEEMNREERIDFFRGYSGKKPGGYYRDRVCLMEIWLECLDGRERDFNRLRQYELSAAMRRLPDWEFTTTVRIKGYGTQRGYKRLKK